jgi:general secretion pathway protein G
MLWQGTVRHRAWEWSGRRRASGLTLLEILMVLAIVGVIASIAYPKYEDYRERIRVNTAITDIRAINAVLRQYILDNSEPPPSLAAVNQGSKLDPWGRPYEYLNIAGASKSVVGKARKNKNLVPINSDFDLYSKGKDGMSSGPLTAGPSRDDVVLANDGKFVGLAKDYE